MLTSLFKLAAVAGVLLAGPAFAHAKLLSASPADGAQLARAPTALTLSFATPVRLGSVAVTSSGRAVPVAVDRTVKATATVVIPLPPLVPGHYEVRWSAVSAEDGHVAKGSLAFTIESTTH